jgi:hypothetical protein
MDLKILVLLKMYKQIDNMMHLKRYKQFSESLTVEPGDQPDVKISKEQFNNTQKYLDQYKKLKSKIEQIYSVTKIQSEVEVELDKILPKEDKENNPFISQLLKINRLQKEILDGRKSDLDNKTRMDEYNDELKYSNGAQKTDIMNKIKELKDKMSTSTLDISKKTKELQNILKEHTQKMTDIEKKLKDDISKINM